jgi:lipoprotein-anchoring transpeptidase ErfK/SrfK
VVDTEHQNAYIYGDDNEVWYVSRCVTGKVGWQIPKGNYHIYTKQRNRYLDGSQYGQDYKLWVNYWMPFYGGAGLHDAVWRSTFWIDPSYYGSHGCINLPFETAKYIYEHSKVGTQVIIK